MSEFIEVRFDMGISTILCREIISPNTQLILFFVLFFSELSKVKVIDMTGPEQRVLSGYHAISSVQRPSDQWEIRKDKKFVNFELPELQHNLNLLVDMCEEVYLRF